MSLDLILEKAEKFEAAIENRHLIEGLILPTLVLPPEGRDDFQTGNYENCAIWTGLYVFAQALKFASTGDISARAAAWNGILALNKLQDITGKSGVVARGYKLREELTWDEPFFWIKNEKNFGQSKTRNNPSDLEDKTRSYDTLFGYRRNNEWHQSGNYRWLGDASKSQVFGILFGYFAYNQFCNPSPLQRNSIKTHVAQIMHSILDHGNQIADIDGKPTTFGNYNNKNSYSVAPALLISQLKFAHHLTGESRFEDEYRRQLDGSIRNGTLTPKRPRFFILNRTHTNLGSDDNLAMLNYLMFMGMQSDQNILGLCREELEKRWHTINDHENSLFNFIYHALTGKESAALLQGLKSLYNFPINKTTNAVALKRTLPLRRQMKDIFIPARIPMQERPVDEYSWRVNPFRHDKWTTVRPGRMEFTGVDFLLAAYFGMYHGFLK